MTILSQAFGCNFSWFKLDTLRSFEFILMGGGRPCSISPGTFMLISHRCQLKALLESQRNVLQHM